MDFRILGPLEVVDDAGDLAALGGGKQRALLARLLLDANRAVAVETLVDDLWGDAVPETATKAVQIYVSQLRKQLGKERIVTRPPGYLLDVLPESVDLFRFERLLAEGEKARADGRPDRAGELLREALGLWRGPALTEFAEPFGQGESARLAELRLRALEERIEADLALGRHASLVGELEALVAANRLRERLQAQQMLALYRSGRQAEALASYQELRRLLDEDLGIAPSASLRELERRILQQDESLEHVGPEATLTAVPPSPRASRGSRGRTLRSSSAVTVSWPLSGRPSNGAWPESGRSYSSRGKRESARRRWCRHSSAPPLTVSSSSAGAPASNSTAPARPTSRVLDALGRLCRGPARLRLVPLLVERAPTWLVQLPGVVDPAELERIEQRALAANRERMLREMTDVLEAFTVVQPLVLVFEDLHWSDPSTLDLLSATARREEPARLLVVATYRPADGEGDGTSVAELAGDLSARGFATDLRLPPFDVETVSGYLTARLGDEGLPVVLAEQLQRRTGGNPLFVEKVVDAWLEDGAARPAIWSATSRRACER